MDIMLTVNELIRFLRLGASQRKKTQKKSTPPYRPADRFALSLSTTALTSQWTLNRQSPLEVATLRRFAIKIEVVDEKTVEACNMARQESETNNRTVMSKYKYTEHYQHLFSILCRSKLAKSSTFTCYFCTSKIDVPLFMKHFQCHKDDMYRCLVCGESMSNQTVNYVFTHFSFCLFPTVIPRNRKNLPIDRAHLMQQLRTRTESLSVKGDEFLWNLYNTTLLQLTSEDSEIDQQVLPKKRKQPNKQELTDNSYDEVNEYTLTCNWINLEQIPTTNYRNFNADIDNSNCNRVKVCINIITTNKQKKSNNDIVCQQVQANISIDCLLKDQENTLPVNQKLEKTLVLTSTHETMAQTSVTAETNEMNCPTCNYEQAHYRTELQDQWPTSELFGVAIDSKQSIDQEYALQTFLSNDIFRQQYYNIPIWLNRSRQTEHLNYHNTGISNIMIDILCNAYNDDNLVLRHVQLYGFESDKALQYLLTNSEKYYLFPYSCLCACGTLTEAQTNNHKILQDLITVAKQILSNEENSIRKREIKLRLNVLKCLMVQFINRDKNNKDKRRKKQEDEAASESDDGTTEELQSPIIKLKTTNTATVIGMSDASTIASSLAAINFRRKHRSRTQIEHREHKVEKILEFLENLIEQQHVQAVKHHRHVIICSRTKHDWDEFSKLFCHRVNNKIINITSKLQTEPDKYSRAKKYLSNNIYFSMTSSHFYNLSHLLNVLISISRPTRPFRYSHFFRIILDINRLVDAWRANDDKFSQDRIANMIANKIVGRDIIKIDKKTNYACPQQRRNTLLFLNRVGRYFLYGGLNNEDSTLQKRHCDFIRLQWSPMSWEDDHFYIAMPILEHGLMMHWAISNDCLTKHVVMLFTKWLWKTKENEVIQTLFRKSATEVYTRLGYIFPYFFHYYPLDHLLPLRNTSSASIDTASWCDMRVQFHTLKQQQTNVNIFGDMLNMIITFDIDTFDQKTQQVLLLSTEK